MLAVFTYLNAACWQATYLKNNRLLFEFNEFEIFFDLSLKENVEYKFFDVNFAVPDNSNRIEELVGNILSINSATISSAQFLGQ